MASTDFTLDGLWQSIGTGVWTITNHGPDKLRWCTTAGGAPTTDILGHPVEVGETISGDFGTDTLYVNGAQTGRITRTPGA